VVLEVVGFEVGLWVVGVVSILGVVKVVLWDIDLV